MRSKNYARNKGISYEQDLASTLRQIWPKALTTRNASRILDSCKVDIAHVPLAIQAKSGYKARRPKADEIFNEMDTLLAKNLPKDSPILGYPKVLIHKMDARKKHNHLVTMNFDDWFDLIKLAYGRQQNESGV